MAETVKQEAQAAQAAQTTPAAPAGERTFTQAELDSVIADRLARERAKYPDYEALKAKAAQFDAQAEAAKSDLQKAQERANKLDAQLQALQKEVNARNARDKVAAETGVPASLLTGETEEACKAQAEALKNWKGPQGNYPDTHDGGAPTGGAGGKTRDQFAGWFESNIKT